MLKFSFVKFVVKRIKSSENDEGSCTHTFYRVDAMRVWTTLSERYSKLHQKMQSINHQSHNFGRVDKKLHKCETLQIEAAE